MSSRITNKMFLTSVTSKFLEHTIFLNIINPLFVNGCIFDKCGFRRLHSSDAQHFECVTNLHCNLESRMETHAIVIDLQKAFD